MNEQELWGTLYFSLLVLYILLCAFSTFALCSLLFFSYSSPFDSISYAPCSGIPILPDLFQLPSLLLISLLLLHNILTTEHVKIFFKVGKIKGTSGDQGQNRPKRLLDDSRMTSRLTEDFQKDEMEMPLIDGASLPSYKKINQMDTYIMLGRKIHKEVCLALYSTYST